MFLTLKVKSDTEIGLGDAIGSSPQKVNCDTISTATPKKVQRRFWVRAKTGRFFSHEEGGVQIQEGSNILGFVTGFALFIFFDFFGCLGFSFVFWFVFCVVVVRRGR